MSRQLRQELDHALQAVIGDMQTAVDELATVLEAERAALGESDTDALNRAGTRKQALMLQLEQLDIERQQLGRESPEAAATLAPEWNRIVQSLRTCRQFNQRNGSEVDLRLRQVRQALSVLTGHAGESSLYGRKGGVHVNLRSRILAEA
jgi:flagellar biosynthesis protein FlgN